MVRLHDVGVSGLLWHLIANFLCDTLSEVRVGDSASQLCVDSSIAQDRVLPPLLSGLLVGNFASALRSQIPSADVTQTIWSSSPIPKPIFPQISMQSTGGASAGGLLQVLVLTSRPLLSSVRSAVVRLVSFISAVSFSQWCRSADTLMLFSRPLSAGALTSPCLCPGRWAVPSVQLISCCPVRRSVRNVWTTTCSFAAVQSGVSTLVSSASWVAPLKHQSRLSTWGFEWAMHLASPSSARSLYLGYSCALDHGHPCPTSSFVPLIMVRGHMGATPFFVFSRFLSPTLSAPFQVYFIRPFHGLFSRKVSIRLDRDLRHRL